MNNLIFFIDKDLSSNIIFFKEFMIRENYSNWLFYKYYMYL